MALADQVIPVDFGGGVDTKTDPKKVVPGKFLLVQNGVYTSVNRVQKRNGYTAVPTTILGGGNLVSPKGIKEFNGELICVDSGKLYGYSPSLQAWISRGNYVSVELAQTTLFQNLSISGHIDCAYLNNYAVFIWNTYPVSGSFASSSMITYASVYDMSAGVCVLAPTVLSTNASPGSITTSSPRAVVLGSSKLAVVYLNSATNALVMRILDTAAMSFGSELTVASSPILPTNSGTPSFGVVGTSSGASVLFPTTVTGSTYWNIANVNTSGSVTGTVAFTQANMLPVATTSDGPCNIVVDSGSGNLWCYWTTLSGGTYTVNFAVYSSALASVHSATALSSSSTNITQIMAVPVSSQAQTVYYSDIGSSAGGISPVPTTYYANIASYALSSSGTWSPGVTIASRYATVSGVNYAVVVSRNHTYTNGSTASTSHPASTATYFLVNLSNKNVIARFASGLADNRFTALNFNYIPNLMALSSTKLLYAFGATFQFESSAGVSSLVGAAYDTFDFNSNRANKAISAGNAVILNGANPCWYDGQICAEWNFHVPPSIIATTSSGFGSLSAGTYSYLAVFQWTDSQGQIHWSGVSNPAAYTSAGPGDAPILKITCPYLTNKSNVSIAIYRTTANGSIYYLLSDPAALVFASGSSATISFTDTLSDANLSGRPNIYTNGGVQENSAPPPFMIAEERYSRLWMPSCETPNTIWYTKSYLPTVGLSPATSAFSLQIDPIAGNVAGLKAMDEKMVVFKDSGIMWFVGDGANDTGQGISLNTPQQLPSDVGLSSSYSPIITPKGIIFQSAKGMYLLDRGMTLHYADEFYNGAAVESFNSQTIVDARIIPNTSQIRFLTTSGYSLVYDYIFNKWASFTNHLGYSSDIWQSSYVYVRTDGAIYQESSSSYLDNATSYQLRVQTSWLALGSVQGFQRVKELDMLGDYVGSAAGHGLQISIAYDFVNSFSIPVQYLFTASASQAPFQYRQFPAQQKCDSLSLLIEEVVTGASGEYVDLTNLSFLAGIKKGTNKFTAANSVG